MNMDSKPIGGEQQGTALEQQGLNPQWGIGHGQIQGQSFSGNFGFDGSANGFPSLGTYPQGDFSQLMQFMPTGMAGSGLGGFPTMMGKLFLVKILLLSQTMSNTRVHQACLEWEWIQWPCLRVCTVILEDKA